MRSDLMKHKVDRALSPEVRVPEPERLDDKRLVSATSRGLSRCPGCAVVSSSFHGSYIHRLQDLPEQEGIVGKATSYWLMTGFMAGKLFYLSSSSLKLDRLIATRYSGYNPLTKSATLIAAL